MAENIKINLKFLLLNAENLFLLSDQKLSEDHLAFDEFKWQKLSTSISENKPLNKLRAIAQIIFEVKPDILMLCEVGGFESLENFNRLFLNDQYSPALVEGNSDRHIDVGFLIRKNIGFYFDLVSNKNRSLNQQLPNTNPTSEEQKQKSLPPLKFSRDAAELHFFLRDRNRPFLVLLLTHLKSHLDPGGTDPHGFLRRRSELQTLVDIYLELEKKFEAKVPIAVAGDFNGNAGAHQTDPEFLDIYQRTALVDVCKLSNLSSDESTTYIQLNRGTRAESKQIDYCFLSPTLTPLLKPKSVQVYRYRDTAGLPLNPPTNLESKFNLPSDHYPLIFEFEGLEIY